MRLKDLEHLENLDNVSIDLEAVHPEGHKVADVFCDQWDKSRLGLESVLLFVKNPIVRLIINIVIGIGNGIQKKICP